MDMRRFFLDCRAAKRRLAMTVAKLTLSRRRSGIIRLQTRPLLLRRLALLAVCCVASAPVQRSQAQSGPARSTSVVAAGDQRLAFHVTPGHAPILVLDAGGGLDSSYWDDIIPEIARRTGSEIITYDRAGTGESTERAPPFSMQDAVDDLETGLRQLGATHDLILVPHSFAGEIATYLAAKHPDWVSGAILVDANVPDFFTQREITRQYGEIRPQIKTMVAREPSKQTRAIAAYGRVFVPINRAFHQTAWPDRIPCIVIVSEKTPFQSKLDARRWSSAQAAFARRAPNRVLVVAARSSHDVAHDRPDVILDAIDEILNLARRKAP